MTPDPQPQSPEQIAREAAQQAAYDRPIGGSTYDYFESWVYPKFLAALTAANAATSAMREELSVFRETALAVRSVLGGYSTGNVHDEPKDVQALITKYDNLFEDRDAWQRRAQESEARVTALARAAKDYRTSVILLDEAQGAYKSIPSDENAHHITAMELGLEAAQECLDHALADLSAAAKKHEAEVADYKWLAKNPDKVRYIAPNWYSGYPDPHSLNPNKWSSTGQWESLFDAIRAARNTASEPQQP